MFTTQPTSAAGTSNCPVTIKSEDIYGNLITSSTYSVTLSLDGNSAYFTPLTSSMTSGVVTFSSCSISGTGTYRFVASATGLTSASSNSFTITQTLKTVTLTAPTSTVYAGVACTVGLTILDSNGLTFLSTATITVTVSSGPGTITTTSITSFVPPVTASVTFSRNGNYVLSVSCSGSNCGALSITTASITVVANAYIDIQ